MNNLTKRIGFRQIVLLGDFQGFDNLCFHDLLIAGFVAVLIEKNFALCHLMIRRF